MGKKLRNLALLGGLGAAAYAMSRKKGESKEDRERDAREKAISGPSKTTSKDTDGDMSAGQAKDSLKDLEKAKKAPVKKADAPVKKASAPTREAPTREAPTREAPTKTPSKTEGLTGSLFDLEMGGGAAERESKPKRSTPRDENLGQMGDVIGAKKGGMIKSSASKRADGIAMKGKTKGRII